MKIKRAQKGTVKAAVRLTLPMYLLKIVDAVLAPEESRLEFIRTAMKIEAERRLGRFSEAAE